MAVTLTVPQLAYSLRVVADTTTTIEEPLLSVLTGLLAASVRMVLDYAPNTPDDIANEAVKRLAGYLYDIPPGSTGRGVANPIGASGAQALIGPYRVRRAYALGEG